MSFFIVAAGLWIFYILNHIGCFDKWRDECNRQWFGKEAFRSGDRAMRAVAFFEYMRRSGYNDFSLCMEVLEEMEKSGLF